MSSILLSNELYILHEAIKNKIGEEELLDLLVKYPNAARLTIPFNTTQKCYPLYMACRYVPDAVRFIFALIIEHRDALNLDFWENKCINPLHLACMHDRPDLVDLIIKSEPFLLNKVNEYDESALDIACKMELGHIVELLLKYPYLDINKRINDDSGQTILHNASWKIIPILLQHNGINVDLRDKKIDHLLNVT
jgi:hypothetical protein